MAASESLAPAAFPPPPVSSSPAAAATTAAAATNGASGASATSQPSAGAGIPSLRDRIPKLEPRRRPPPPENALPVPPTPPLPPPMVPSLAAAHTHAFALPRRRILSRHDHDLFLASPTCSLIQAWVFGLADAVVDTPAGVFAEALKAADTADTAAAERGAQPPTEDDGPLAVPRAPKTYQKGLPQRPLSPVVYALLAILDEVEALVYANPPDAVGGSRFGNKRFRGFVDQVRQRAASWHTEKLGMASSEVEQPRGAGEATTAAAESTAKPLPPSAVAEAATYLGQAFGNRARIDYGSGHELHFVVWLLCLYQVGVVRADDRPALVLCVFARYLDVMRVVQTTYYLEPAGSHGVWGLDDYQFLPFLFGAAQLLHHRYITPRAVHQPLTLEQFGDDYLYLGQVRFVNSIKVATTVAVDVGGGGGSGDTSARGSNSMLRWHSPMLDDISATKTWAKVAAGMRRMFVAEVLRKLPVMQHFLFGSLVPAAPGMTEARTGGGTGTAQEEGDNDAVDDDDDDDEDAIVDGNDTVDVFEEGGVRHIHNPSGWGDCCGIRVPSSLGAAGEMRKHGSGGGLRRIPFD